MTFSEHSTHEVEVYIVEDGVAKRTWSGSASETQRGTAPYVAITTYGLSPDNREPTRLHIVTSSTEQTIIDLPAGKLWNNLTSHAGILSDATVIYTCSIYPEHYTGNFVGYNALGESLEACKKKSKESGWRYIVVLGRKSLKTGEQDGAHQPATRPASEAE